MTIVDTTTGEVVSDAKVIDEFTVEQAVAHTAKINHAVGFAGALVIEAWERRIWTTLSYRSWEDYCEAELAADEQSPASRAALMVGLRKAGASYRAIAAASGQSVGKVHRDLAGVHPVNTSTVTGIDGKQYDSSQPSKIRRTETVEFMGEAGTGDGPAMSSGGPSPAFDPGEAALGDDADTPSPFPSPGSPIDVEPPQEAPSTPVEADGTARPDASTGPRTVALAARELAKASQFFAMFSPDDIHELNDPEVTATVEYLIAVARNWANEFEATQPHGLTVIEGGRQ